MNTTCKFLSYAAPTLALMAFPLVACSDNAVPPVAMGGQASGASGAPTSGTSSGGQAAAGTTSGGTSSGGMAGGSTAGAPAGGGGGGGTAAGGGGAGMGGASGGGAGGGGGMGGAGGTSGSGQGGVGGTHMGPVTGMGAYVRTSWTAVYTCTGTCPTKGPQDMNDAEPRAFDGMASTRWSTGVYQDKMMDVFPLYFTVDMKQINSISKMTFDAGGDPYDAPGEMDVLVSNDGTNFTTVLSAYKPTAPAMGNKPETVMLPAGTVGQFIKLKATKTIHQVSPNLGDRYWAIGEMNVYP